MIFFFLKICLFTAALGLCCCKRAFSICSKWGLATFFAVASHFGGFSCCRAQALGAWAQQLQRLSTVVVAHGSSCSETCGIFLVRDGTHVPCIGRWILNHWTTREAPKFFKRIIRTCIILLLYLGMEKSISHHDSKFRQDKREDGWICLHKT